MNKPPLLLFLFANDEDAYLENLKKEDREIRNILLPLHKSGRIEFRSIAHTITDDIFKNMGTNLEEIAIFYYGGHAGGTQHSTPSRRWLGRCQRTCKTIWTS